MASFFRNLFKKDGDETEPPGAVATAEDAADGESRPGGNAGDDRQIFMPVEAIPGEGGGLPFQPAGLAGQTGPEQFTVRELSMLLPFKLVRADGLPPDAPVLLPLDALRASLAQGKATIRLGQIFVACPQMFSRELHPSDDMDISLPFQKVRRMCEASGHVPGAGLPTTSGSGSPSGPFAPDSARPPGPFTPDTPAAMSPFAPSGPPPADSPFTPASPPAASPFAPAGGAPAPAPGAAPAGAAAQASPFALARPPEASPASPFAAPPHSSVQAASPFAFASPGAAAGPSPFEMPAGAAAASPFAQAGNPAAAVSPFTPVQNQAPAGPVSPFSAPAVARAPAAPFPPPAAPPQHPATVQKPVTAPAPAPAPAEKSEPLTLSAPFIVPPQPPPPASLPPIVLPKLPSVRRPPPQAEAPPQPTTPTPVVVVQTIAPPAPVPTAPAPPPVPAQAPVPHPGTGPIPLIVQGPLPLAATAPTPFTVKGSATTPFVYKAPPPAAPAPAAQAAPAVPVIAEASSPAAPVPMAMPFTPPDPLPAASIATAPVQPAPAARLPSLPFLQQGPPPQAPRAEAHPAPAVIPAPVDAPATAAQLPSLPALPFLQQSPLPEMAAAVPQPAPEAVMPPPAVETAAPASPAPVPVSDPVPAAVQPEAPVAEIAVPVAAPVQAAAPVAEPAPVPTPAASVAPGLPAVVAELAPAKMPEPAPRPATAAPLPDISLSLRAVLRDVNPRELGFDPANVPEAVRVTLAGETIKPQLASGRVEVGIDDIRRGIADRFRPAFARAQEGLRINVPLSEVFQNLPDEFMSAALAAAEPAHIAITTSPFQTPFALRADEDEGRIRLPSLPVAEAPPVTGPRPPLGPVPPAVETTVQGKPVAPISLPPLLSIPGSASAPAPAPSSEPPPRLPSPFARPPMTRAQAEGEELPSPVRAPRLKPPNGSLPGVDEHADLGQAFPADQLRTLPPSHQTEPPAPLPEDLSFGYQQDPKQLALRAVFMTEKTLGPKDVVNLSSAFPGIRACMIITSQSVTTSDRDAEVDAVRSFTRSAPRTWQSLMALAESIGMGQQGSFTLRTDQGVVSFFVEKGTCMAVLHEHPSFQPGVREKLILVTREIALMLG